MKKSAIEGRDPYPIFSECVEYTDDEFWRGIFQNLALGKCPKGLYIARDVICSSNTKHGVFYRIPRDGSPEEVYNEVKALFTDLGICSARDISIKTAELTERDDVTDDTVWSDIRKKTRREMYIMKWVLRMRRKHGLSWSDAQHLHNIVQWGFACKTQTSRDVTFRNRRIESIAGIEYNPDTHRFHNTRVAVEPEEHEEAGRTRFCDYWEKYVTVTNR